jgi:hypothetical protein
MILPPLLTGPRFEEGDLVSFTFDDCELTYRVPVVPQHSEVSDFVSQSRDFQEILLSDWEEYNGRHLLILSRQNWYFEYEIGRQDIIYCYLKVTLIKHNEQEAESEFCLDSIQFKKFLLNVFQEDHPISRFPDRADWPSINNQFFMQSVNKSGLEGVVAELDTYNTGSALAMNAYFAINKSFVIIINFELSAIYYEGIDYPYSPEFLRQFKKDLFDDFLSHVKIEYSGETLKTIQQKNKHS